MPRANLDNPITEFYIAEGFTRATFAQRLGYDNTATLDYNIRNLRDDIVDRIKSEGLGDLRDKVNQYKNRLKAS